MASRPVGEPTLKNFELIETPIPPLKDGEVLIQTYYLSVDPYMRARMRNVKSYVAPLEIGEVMDGGIVGRVVESKSSRFTVGEFVTGRLRWADYCVSSDRKIRKVPPDPDLLSAHVGVLGMTGLTAYFALLDIGQPKPGETVLISGAAGAVGSIAGQIAKIKGCRAVGIVGSDEKARLITRELGFDTAVNYKTSSNIRKALKDACPNGLDVYFDNVGGPISDAAVTLMNLKARVIVCGQISQANLERPETGPRNWLYFLVRRAKLEGFLVHDYQDRYQEGLNNLNTWLKQGKLKYRETLVEGLENAPKALIGLFHGENTGKQIVKIYNSDTTP